MNYIDRLKLEIERMTEQGQRVDVSSLAREGLGRESLPGRSSPAERESPGSDAARAISNPKGEFKKPPPGSYAGKNIAT